MINKETIRQRINYTESLLQAYKNEYPKNISDCWRKRAPFLIIALATILPFAFLTTTSVILLLLAVVPIIVIICIIEIIMCMAKYRRKEKTRTAITDSLANLNEYMDYSDVRQYCEKTNTAVDNLNSQKKKMRSKANTISILTIVGSIVFSLCSMILPAAFNTNTNFNMDFLGFNNLDTFEAQYLKSGNVDVATEKCTFRMENYLLNNKENDEYGCFRLRATNLDIRGVKDDDILIMKITDKDGVPKAFVPEFIFNGSRLKTGKGVISAPQDETINPFENYEALKSIKAGGLYFTVEKVN